MKNILSAFNVIYFIENFIKINLEQLGLLYFGTTVTKSNTNHNTPIEPIKKKGFLAICFSHSLLSLPVQKNQRK